MLALVPILRYAEAHRVFKSANKHAMNAERKRNANMLALVERYEFDRAQAELGNATQ